MLFGGLGTFALAATERGHRRAALEVPLCAICFGRRTKAKWLIAAAAAIVVAAFAFVVLGGVPPAWGTDGMLLILGGASALLVGAIFLFRARDLRALHIDLEEVVIGGVAEAARQRVMAETAPTYAKKRRAKSGEAG